MEMWERLNTCDSAPEQDIVSADGWAGWHKAGDTYISDRAALWVLEYRLKARRVCAGM